MPARRHVFSARPQHLTPVKMPVQADGRQPDVMILRIAPEFMDNLQYVVVYIYRTGSINHHLP